jgi:ABC-type sugar transport system ATPase subunit
LAGVELRGLGKVFPNGVEAVSGVDLSVAEGELLAVVGPSGSGKSTLLRLVAGLESPTAGAVLIGGRDVTGLPPRDRDVAMVFQEPALYPYLAVFDNLAFGLRARGAVRAEVKERVEAVAGSLGLSGVLGRRPGTLSGGQRQRVALGRAVVRRPAVFLFDEPLSSLDAPLRASVRGDLIDLHRRLGATMIYVTHDQGEALALGDRVAVIDRGRVVQVASPGEVYERPATRSVAGFIGNPPMNLLACEVLESGREEAVRLAIAGSAERVEFALPDGRWTGLLSRRHEGRVDLGLRPEHVRLSRAGESLDPGATWLDHPATVLRVEYLGHESVATLGLGPWVLACRVPTTARVRAGEGCAVGLVLDRASWFDPETGASIAT